MIEFDPNALAVMAARHKTLMQEAALEGAVDLERNLSSTQGTGVHWSGLPNRSSAPGEYPVRQSGQLQSGVGVEEGNGTAAEVVIRDDLGKLLGLEFSPPSSNPNQPGTPNRRSGGRAPMWETFTDGQTISDMSNAMKRS